MGRCVIPAKAGIHDFTMTSGRLPPEQYTGLEHGALRHSREGGNPCLRVNAQQK
jgi:hypothetical protein